MTTNNTGRLDGKNALVTGATSGIGRGIAEEFAKEGATVGVNHLPNDEEAQRAADIVESIRAAGGSAVAVAGDVSDADSVSSMVNSYHEAVGSVDILVNNAGILTQRPFPEIDAETWDETIDTDLRGVFLTTRATIDDLLTEDGVVINIASQLGIKGGTELVHYSAAKAGVIGFTRALARELSPEVRVNAIAPGPIETNMLDDITADWKKEKAAELPMDRLGRVEDITPTAVFLASDGASYYTGQVLSPDGGDAMH